MSGIYSGLHYKKQYYQESAFMRVTTESATEGALVQVMSGRKSESVRWAYYDLV